jgi:hypothetical protein
MMCVIFTSVIIAYEVFNRPGIGKDKFTVLAGRQGKTLAANDMVGAYEVVSNAVAVTTWALV